MRALRPHLVERRTVILRRALEQARRLPAGTIK